MRVLFDVNHPAHVHFFKGPAKMLAQAGHEVVFTSREKEMTTDLLEELGVKHHVLSRLKGGFWGLLVELLVRDWRLWRLVRECRPDVMASIGGTFISHVGALTGIPSLVFYDTENARLQNSITYPFATEVIVPNCYSGWLPKGGVRYPGYHELSYLHPDVFSPSLDIALRAGLVEGKKNIFLRLVSWQANHDVGEVGWSFDLLDRFCSEFGHENNLLISSEATLPERFSKYRYKGHVSDIHHVLAFSSLVVGESATMASEAAVLGVPAIYMAESGRGYTDEQERRFSLVKNIRSLDVEKLFPEVKVLLQLPASELQRRREGLLSATINVADYIVERILNYRERV